MIAVFLHISKKLKTPVSLKRINTAYVIKRTFNSKFIYCHSKTIFMIKNLLSLFSALVIVFNVSGQTVTISSTAGTTTQLNGLGSDKYHVSEYLYTESEIGASNFTTAATSINRINLYLTALSDLGPYTFNNVKIYLKEVPTSTTALTAATYNTSGYTLVYNGSFPATALGWQGVILNNPFQRTSGMNLQMMIERTDNVLPTTAVTPPTWATANVNNTSRRYNGSTPLSGTTNLGLSAFRVSVQFAHALANDASVGFITSSGKLPLGYGGSQAITVTVKNEGSSTLSNLPVTLNIAGANTYTNVQTIASLAPLASTKVTFSGYVPAAVGNNTITITVPADGDNTNNSATQNQVITTNTFALSNDDAYTPGGSIGFNTGSGNLLVKMPVYINNSLSAVRVSISNEAVTAGNTVYGVLVSSAGAIIAKTADYVIQNSDLGQFVTFSFAAPQPLSADSVYYIGLGQTANATTGYYPVNAQASKTNLAHSTTLTGGNISDYSTFGSLMIEGILVNSLPVTLTHFSGTKEGSVNKLFWITATEANNKGFELERSADGKNFSKLGFVSSKATEGNSNAELKYSFVDENILKGTNYYRLKQVDKDGKSTYSSVVVLKGDATDFQLALIYPNPVKAELNVKISSNKNRKVTLALTDINGRQVQQISRDLIAGDNFIKLNVVQLPKGAYQISIISSDAEVKTSKFIKE